ncbi:hypothetical protein K8I85_05780, partial [bacterium]|nr:hypothetical protein [bacterium]
MTEPDVRLPRARVRDLLRPATLYAGIDARPTFMLPILLLVLSAALYLEIAADVVLPSLVSTLLDRSLVTESKLRQTFHTGLLSASFLVPMFWVPLGALVARLILRAGRARIPYPLLVSLLAYSALWIALGFVAKALIVVGTGHPAPSTNVGALLHPQTGAMRALACLTNPFLFLSVLWTANGLRHFGAGAAPAWIAGTLPWTATAILFATVFAGENTLSLDAPVPVDDWPTATVGSITVRTPPEQMAQANGIATDLDTFARQVTQKFGVKERHVRVYVYPDHRMLERAVGERLHVLVTGSIRGSDLLYVEMPGSSAAVTAERSRRDALRLVALTQLAPVTMRAPRWFVEGVVHAMVEPGTPDLDREFRTLVRRYGVPSLGAFADGSVFRTPGGPLLARSLVDHIAALYGPAAVVKVLQAVVGGGDFRDALFAETRLTATELETGWQENLR